MIGIIMIASFMAATIGAFALASITYDWAWGYRRIVRSRLSAIHGLKPGAISRELFYANDDVDNFNCIGRLLASLRNLVELAWPSCPAGKFLLIQLGVATFTPIIGYFVSQQLWAIPMGFLLGLTIPLVYARLIVRRKVSKITRQLPAAFDVLSKNVQAGHSIQSSLQVIAEEFEPPISTEFARCVGHAKFGVASEKVYRELAVRFPVKEMRMLMVALIIQNRSGGNLSGLLNKLSETVRARIRMNGKLKALTSEGRVQAKVMMFLPAVALGLIQLGSPEYAAPLWRNSGVLFIAFALQVIGTVWIFRIVNSCNFLRAGT